MTTCAEFETKFALADGYSRAAPVATFGTCATCRFRSQAEVPEWAGWHICNHPHIPPDLAMVRMTYACSGWGSREPDSGQIIGAEFRLDVY